MTDRELATLLRQHVADEPPLGIDPTGAILAGRRAVRRRRVRRGAAALVIGTAAAISAPFVLGGDGGTTGMDPATQRALADYDAAAMPDVLFRAVGPTVEEWTPELAPTREFTAYDDQGTALPERHWDKASSMELAFGGQGPHRLRFSLMHARSEAEGDAREHCREELESGYAFSCFVTTVDGDTVTTSVTAVRPLEQLGDGWGALTEQELRSGRINPTNPSQEPLDRDEVYFLKTSESVHSETFLTVAQEIVKAPNLTQAQAAWRLSDLRLREIVSDPSLVIPEPPLGKGGCAWTWKIEVTCGRSGD